MYLNGSDFRMISIDVLCEFIIMILLKRGVEGYRDGTSKPQSVSYIMTRDIGFGFQIACCNFRSGFTDLGAFNFLGMRCKKSVSFVPIIS